MKAFRRSFGDRFEMAMILLRLPGMEPLEHIATIESRKMVLRAVRDLDLEDYH